MIRIAIQKSGRLNDESLLLLRSCGIIIPNAKKSLKVRATNFPIEILNLRNSDIPEYVSDGIADIGIVGENTIIEKEKPLNKVKKLGFGKCRLSLAVPKETKYKDASFFNGKKIATSYHYTLRKYLKENNIEAGIHEINGSVEIAPGIGLADGICDLVESGNTLTSNGLKEVEVLLRSEALLISSPNINEENSAILNDLIFRIDSHLKAKQNKYVILNIPNDKIEAVSKLLPGMKSPTVMPLNKEGWSAIQSVIAEDDFWGVIKKLKEAGAESILVVPIEKMIF